MILVVLIAFFLVEAPAAAHTTSLTTGKLHIDGTAARFELEVSAHDLAVALGIETDLTTPIPQASFEARQDVLSQYLRTHLYLAANGEACESAPPVADYADLPDEIDLSLAFTCPAHIAHIALTYLLFFDIDPAHRSLGKLITPDGAAEEFLFDSTIFIYEAEVAQPAPQLPWAERFARIFVLGVEHILVGYDHILFVLALLLVSARFWQIIKVVTAFTVAHSLTLGLAWYGVIELSARLVESLIALSIAYVAVENIVRRRFERRWAVAGGFGLVHGLGFYSVLSDLDLGGSGVVTTLLAFNLGVEAGQVAIVALFYLPLVWWLRQSWYLASARAASMLILAVAAWWLVERALLA